jgi:hemoglobin-like flavoprotein
VEAISSTYGQAAKPAVEIAYHSNYGEVASVLARWENSEYSYSLIRTGDQTSLALILTSTRVDALAQAAIAEACRLDALEAPQRAIDLQKKQEAEDRRALDEARSANLPNFRP